MGSYTGKDLVRGYCRWYGTDALTAVVELRLLGVAVPDEREAQIRKTIEQKAKASAARTCRCAEETEWALESDAFAYIAGYTSSGAPYGLTWDEWEQIEYEEKQSEEETDAG